MTDFNVQQDQLIQQFLQQKQPQRGNPVPLAANFAAIFGGLGGTLTAQEAFDTVAKNNETNAQFQRDNDLLRSELLQSKIGLLSDVQEGRSVRKGRAARTKDRDILSPGLKEEQQAGIDLTKSRTALNEEALGELGSTNALKKRLSDVREKEVEARFREVEIREKKNALEDRKLALAEKNATEKKAIEAAAEARRVAREKREEELHVFKLEGRKILATDLQQANDNFKNGTGTKEDVKRAQANFIQGEKKFKTELESLIETNPLLAAMNGPMGKFFSEEAKQAAARAASFTTSPSTRMTGLSFETLNEIVEKAGELKDSGATELTADQADDLVDFIVDRLATPQLLESLTRPGETGEEKGREELFQLLSFVSLEELGLSTKLDKESLMTLVMRRINTINKQRKGKIKEEKPIPTFRETFVPRLIEGLGRSAGRMGR